MNDDGEILVDNILGPKSLCKYTRCNIIIYIFGEQHTAYSSCKKCNNIGDFIRTPLFITNLIKSQERIEKGTFIDFFLEKDRLISNNSELVRKSFINAKHEEINYKETPILSK